MASLAAAYALVLNVVFSSMLLASVSPADAAAGFEICANNPDLAAAHGDDGKTTGKIAVHCPICVGQHAPGAPPSHEPHFASRFAVAIAPVLAPDVVSVARPANADHQARAPPRLS